MKSHNDLSYNEKYNDNGISKEEILSKWSDIIKLFSCHGSFLGFGGGLAKGLTDQQCWLIFVGNTYLHRFSLLRILKTKFCVIY